MRPSCCTVQDYAKSEQQGAHDPFAAFFGGGRGRGGERYGSGRGYGGGFDDLKRMRDEVGSGGGKGGGGKGGGGKGGGNRFWLCSI